MLPDPEALARLLTLAALIGATVEYCEVMKRREYRRQVERMAAEAARNGLLGLVRVFIAD